MAFNEDADGYAKLLSVLGPAEQTLVAIEATGHYWQNLFAILSAEGFAIVRLRVRLLQDLGARVRQLPCAFFSGLSWHVPEHWLGSQADAEAVGHDVLDVAREGRDV